MITISGVNLKQSSNVAGGRVARWQMCTYTFTDFKAHSRNIIHFFFSILNVEETNTSKRQVLIFF